MARVLVVDDEAGYRTTLKDLLVAEGYSVETAESGEDAIEVSGRAYPDVLIADWKLKNKLSGLDVVRALRASNPRLPALFITGHSVDQLRAEAHDLDEVQVLEKPFVADSLLNMISDISTTKGT